MSFAAIRRWRRSSSARFAMIFLLLFGAASISLFAFVHDRAIAHFNAQTDEWLGRETVKIPSHPTRAEMIERVARHNHSDVCRFPLRSDPVFPSRIDPGEGMSRRAGFGSSW